MKLSEHFDSAEFESGGDQIPPECMDVFRILCMQILEPIRAFVAKPIRITSGYRSPARNALVHGVTNSEHLATPEHCACDFTFMTTFGMMMSVRRVFDWIRENPTLPFHQVILEHGAAGQSIIHISYNAEKLGTRSALEGATHNASAYTPWDCVAYNAGTASSGQENA